MPEPPEKELLTPEQVARLLGIERGTVMYLKRTGKLPFVRSTERNIRFRRSDVEAYIKANTVEAVQG